MYPSFFKTHVKKDADILINLANSAWFHDSWISKTLFEMAIFRAVENGRFVIQVSNIGISGIVSPEGHIVASSELNKKAFIKHHFSPYKKASVPFDISTILGKRNVSKPKPIIVKHGGGKVKKTLEQVKKELNRELDLGLALSKAEGNLNFLAGESQQNNLQSSITQGMAILDALEAVQVARKAWQEIIHEKRKAN